MERKRQLKKENREREREREREENSTVFQDTHSLSWESLTQQDGSENMSVTQKLMEKKYITDFSLNEFKIEALGIVGSCNFICNKKMEILDKNGNRTGKFTYNAKGTLYRKFNPQTDKMPAFKNIETGELYSSIYARILIKRLLTTKKTNNEN